VAVHLDKKQKIIYLYYINKNIKKMGYTYEWVVTAIKKATFDDINDAIIGTQWKVICTDNNGNTGEFSGATPFDLNTMDIENFIEYQNLTEVQVLDWIKNVVSGSSSTNYWSHIQGQMDKQISEKTKIITEVGTSNLPWNTGSLSDIIPPAPIVG
jgi:hypothetical protein